MKYTHKPLTIRLLYPLALLLFLISGTRSFAQSPPVIHIVNTNHPTCVNYYRDGEILVAATGGVPPYWYTINTQLDLFRIGYFPGLQAGTYRLIVFDADSRSDTIEVTLANPTLPLGVSVTQIQKVTTCNASDGRIGLTATGGTPPYQYSIDNINYQTSNVIDNLSAGSYYYYVKDAAGCIARDNNASSNVIVNPIGCPAPVLSVSSEGACTNEGELTVIAAPAGGPYTYSINGTTYVSPGRFFNLPAGIHTVYIKNSTGDIYRYRASLPRECIFWATVQFAAPDCAQNNLTLTVVTTNNEDAPYTYTIDGINYQTSNVFTNLPASVYNVLIRGNSGKKLGVVPLSRGPCPVVIATSVDETCARNDGSITAIPRYSTQPLPLQYSIDGLTFQTSNIFTGLAAGEYTVTMKDGPNRIATTKAIVRLNCYTANAVPTHTSCGDQNGVITTTTIGGTAPYEYTLNGTTFQSSNIFTALAAGDYTVTVKDATGQIITTTVTTINSSVNTITLEAGNDMEVCAGKSIQINPSSNGTSFEWAPYTSLNDRIALSPVASPLITTKYYITARIGSCERIDSVTVSVNPLPIANAGNTITICKGQDARLNGSGGVAYRWSPATYLSDPADHDPLVLHPPSSITYQLQVEDAKGCRSIQPSLVTVEVKSNLRVFAGNDTSIVMNEPYPLSAIDINASGFISYTWSPPIGLSDPSAQYPITTLDHDIIYKVTAVTAGDCEATDEIKIKVYKGPDIYVPNAFTPNNDGLNDVVNAVPIGIKNFKYFAIYNRWGNRLFYTTDPRRSWDGRNANISLDAQTFVWIAEGTDDKGRVIQKKGTIILVR